MRDAAAQAPVPAAHAADRLRLRIRDFGPISFAVFMDEALYGEDGYYRRSETPIGPDGDFVTGSTAPLFGRATARLLRRLDGLLGLGADGRADYLEVGYGAATHLAEIAAAAAPAQSTPRRILAHDRVRRALPRGVRWLDALDGVAAPAIEGLLFSYELFDALPVHRLIGSEGGVGELHVGLDRDGGFRWQPGELSDPALLGLLGGCPLLVGQIADVAPGAGPLYRHSARALRRGLLVTCDYGFETARLFDPRVRFHGTLACHRRHRVHRDPFCDVGEQDLTAHVDFGRLRRIGEEAGLETVAFTRQAQWLLACGIEEDLRDGSSEIRREAAILLDGEGMGETIRVLVQARDLDGAAIAALFDAATLPRWRTTHADATTYRGDRRDE